MRATGQAAMFVLAGTPYLLAIFVTLSLAVATGAQAHDCSLICGTDVSCGQECLGSNRESTTCGASGKQCYNAFGKCGDVCGSEVACSTACNRDDDGSAATCGALGNCIQAGDNTGPSPPPASVNMGDSGSVLQDLSFHRKTFQSSTDFGGDSSRAVDGDPDGIYLHGSVTHTKQQDSPEWHVIICSGSIEKYQSDRLLFGSAIGR